MTRKSKAVIGFLGLAVVGPPIAWLIFRPKPALEFKGKAPQAQILARSEFEGRPWVDWKAPGGTLIIFPKKRKLTSSKPDPAVAGYILYDESSPPYSNYFVTDRLKVDNDVVGLPLSYLDEPAKMAIPPPLVPGRRHLIVGARAVSRRMVLGIPYATEERYRDATLLHDQDEYPVRLNVSHEFGPAIRRTETFPVGPWKIFAKPRIWKVTTQEVVFDFSTDAPAGTRFLVRPTWKFGSSSGSRWFTGSKQLLIVEGGGQSAPLLIRRGQSTAKFDGEIIELTDNLVQLTPKHPKGSDLRLYLPNGNLVFTQGAAVGFERNQLLMIDVRGRRLAEGFWDEMGDGRSYTFESIRDGETVDAIAYRAKRRFPISGEFDVPPAFEEVGQFTFYSRGHPGYGYIPPP